jgi:hypothetical protein
MAFTDGGYITPEDIAPYQSGGNSPSPGEAMRRFKATERYYDLQRYALATDRRVNMVNSTMAGAFKGGSQTTEAWARSDTGRVSRDLIGLAASHGALGGGNPVALIAGMASANGMNQFRVGGPGGGMSALAGGGMMADMITKQMYSAFQNHAFTSTGAANLNVTNGFNKDQMGDIFKLMGQRGMMSGMKMGGFEMANGKLSFLEDKGSMNRVLQQFEGVSKMLANVRDLVGDRHVTELARAAESLTGLSLRNANPAKLGERLNRVRNNASMLNLDVESYMGAHEQLMGMVAPLVGRPMASVMALRAGETSGIASMGRTQMVGAAAARGEHIANFSTGEIAAQGMQSQLQMMSENPQLLEASFAAQNMTDDNKSKLNAAIGAFSKVSSREERIAASANLRKVFEQTSGVTTGTYSRQYSTQRMLNTIGPEQQENLHNALSGMDQSMNKNVIAKQMAENNNFGSGAVGGLGAKQMGGSMHAFMSLAPDEQQDIIDKLHAGNTVGAQEALTAASKDLQVGGISKEAISGLGKILAGGADSGAFLNKGRSILAGDPRLQGIVHPRLVREAKEAAAMRFYAENVVGDADDRSKPDMGEQFYQGLVNGVKTDNQTVLMQAGADVETFAIDPETKMPVIAPNLEALLNTYGAPGKDGKPGTEFSDAIRGKSVVEKNDIMRRYLENKGVAFSVDIAKKTGTAVNAGKKKSILDHDQFLSEAAQELSLKGVGGAAGAAEIEALANKKEADAKNKTYNERAINDNNRAEIMKERMDASSALWTGALEGTGGWMANALKEGDGNTAFDMVMKRSLADPKGFEKDLKKAKEDLADKTGDSAETKGAHAAARKNLAALEDKMKEAKATPDQKTADNTKKILDLLRLNLT